MMEVVVQSDAGVSRILASGDPWRSWIWAMLGAAAALGEEQTASVHMVDPDDTLCQYNGSVEHIDEDVYGLRAAVLVSWYPEDSNRPTFSGTVGDGFHGAAAAVLRDEPDSGGVTYGGQLSAPVLVLSMPGASEAEVLQASKDHPDSLVVVVL